MSGQHFDVITMIVGSLALIMTYSWNNLIQQYINHYYPIDNESLTVKTYYTITMTFIITIVVFYLTKYKDVIQSPVNNIMNRVLI
jgi:hypothetical protein